jgi:hypothetical protein
VISGMRKYKRRIFTSHHGVENAGKCSTAQI